MRPIVSSGLRWPVAGVEAMRIFTRSSYTGYRKSASPSQLTCAGILATLEVRFAQDSALEGDGFEPSVPGAKEPVFGGESELRVIETGASHKKLFSLGE